MSQQLVSFDVQLLIVEGPTDMVRPVPEMDSEELTMVGQSRDHPTPPH